MNNSTKILKQNRLAFVYDFDGTLTPQPMQEYTVLPELGLEAEQFWSEVDEESHCANLRVILNITLA